MGKISVLGIPRWIRQLSVLLILASATLPNLVHAADDTAAPRDRALVAANLYSAVSTYFAHFDAIPGFDLEVSFGKFLDEAFAAKGRFEFDLACLAFVAALENGHSDFDDRWLWENYGRPFGLHAVDIDGAWVVTRSTVQEIPAGTTLATIDGMEVETYYQSKKRYISGSNDRERRSNFFARRYLFPSEFVLRTGAGAVVKIQRSAPQKRENLTEGHWITPRVVAYIKIPSFEEPSFEQEALKRLEEFKDAKSLIVDVRRNGGGNTPSLLIDALMDRPYRGASTASPLRVAVWSVWGKQADQVESNSGAPRDENYGFAEAMREVGSRGMFVAPPSWTKPAKTVFRGQVIILIDRYVASAAEDFLIPFKDNHRATLIGEATFGSTGQPYYKTFPNGMNFRVSAKRDSFPDGTQFEGVGVRPDLEVKTTAADLRAGTDRVLERAREVAETAK